MKNLLLLAVMLQAATAISKSDIVVNPLKGPLLPFNLGKARIVESKHTFIHYINIGPIRNQLSSIRNFYNIVEASLFQIPRQQPAFSHYNTLTNILSHAKYLILEAENKLSNVTPQERSKRGLINVIGKASKWLFGTLDSEDEERYNEAINKLQNNQKSTMEEMSLQISLTKQLIENVNATISLLDANQRLIKNRLQYFEFNVNKTLNDISAYLRAQNTLDQIILNCQNLITFLDNLENALMFAKVNTLHSTVLSTKEIFNLIKHLRELYNDSQIINFENTNSYYEIAGLQVKYFNDKIIFAIHFPIVKVDIFNSFHLFPVPIERSIILPNQPYLLLGNSQQQYGEEPCPTIEDIQICQNNLEPLSNGCIPSLIHEAENDHCEAIHVDINYPIIESISGQYVMVIPAKDAVKLYKQCVSNEYIFIEEPSLIEIPRNCGIKINDSQFWNKEEVIPAKPLNLPKIKVEKISQRYLEENPITLHTIDIKKIQELKKQARFLTVPDVPDIHPLTWCLIPILAILVIACTFLYIFSRKFWIPRITPHPVERATTENNPNVLFSS